MNPLSFIGQLFAGGNPIKSIGDAIHENVTTDKERLELANEAKQAAFDFQIKEDTITAGSDAAELEVENTEARSANFFIAGARPALLWVCVLKLALLAFHDEFIWVTNIINGIWHLTIATLPPIDMGEMLKIWLPITSILIGAREIGKAMKTDTQTFK